MDSLAKATAELARNQINILSVTFDEGYIEGIEFEYGWRVTPTSMKWTRAFFLSNESRNASKGQLADYYSELLSFVKQVRDSLEG